MSNPDEQNIPGTPQADESEYEHLLEDYSHLAPPSEGELLSGRVIKITPKEVFVDIGYKVEGVVPIEQFPTPLALHPGDTIDVIIDRHQQAAAGYIALSHEKATRLHAWDTLKRAFRENLLISGRVTGRTKGGLSVDVGVPAFMPGSQIDMRPVHNIDSFIGQDIAVRILKLNQHRGNVVVSRKMAVEEETNARKSTALEHLHEGSEISGTVKNLTDYGAFIDLGGIDGLLHVSDISYGRVTHPSEMLTVGDTITAKVLKFDRDKERISLGMKQLAPDPWLTASERFPVGARVVGRVVSVTDYGTFVELETGVEGLIHISEMTWSRRMKHPSKVVKVGDQVEAVVLEVKPRERRISLGMKQLEADPWTTVAERYAVGSVVEGRVRKLADFGAFVEIEEGIDGLVHISDVTWAKRIKHPSEALKKGQIVQAVILNIDAPERRLSLGMKQLQPDAWETFFATHQVGDVVRGRVCRAASFGLFIEIVPGVEGLCHKSEVPPPLRDGSDPLPLNSEADFKIVKLNEHEKKIGLSLRAAAREEERQRLEDYHKQAAKATEQIERAMRPRKEPE